MSVQIGVINAVGPIGRTENAFPFVLAPIRLHLRRSVSRQPAGAASHKWHYRSPRFALLESRSVRQTALPRGESRESRANLTV